MYNKCIRRIWRLPFTSHKSIVYSISGHKPMQEVLISRFSKMYSCMCNVDNQVMNFIAKRANSDCTSFIGANVQYVKQYVPKNWHVNVDHLLELIECRDGLMDLHGFPIGYVNFMIDELSTS